MLDAVRMRVQSMVEKPRPDEAPGTAAIVGRYALPADAFGILEGLDRGAGGEIQLTDALAALARDGRVTGRFLTGRWLDTGTPTGLLDAWLRVGLADPARASDVHRVLDGIAGR
jgi:UTP--glucose-1-phosphate uridylyltransferase